MIHTSHTLQSQPKITFDKSNVPAVNRAFLIVLIGVLLSERVLFTWLAPPIGDEAYYWMWGQKLGWSYFDHPPLHAWLLHGMNFIFGWNYFALRGLTWVTFAGTVWIIWLWSKRLSPPDPQKWFWPTVALYLASPMFSMMTVIAFHDHLLTFLCLLSGHFLLVFWERYVATRNGLFWLYAASVALGFGILTKYNAALVGVAGGIFILLNRDLRPLLKTLHPWLAAVIAIQMQFPVLIWNYQEGFASYKFHLEDRWDSDPGFNYLGIPNFILTAVLVLSPFLVPSVIRMIRYDSENGFARQARLLALYSLAASSAVMAYISTFGDTNFYWNITAFVLIMPLLIGWLQDHRMLIAHYVLGVVLTTALLVNTIIMPLQNIVGRNDWTISSGFGWPEVAERISELRSQHQAGFIATTFYSTAAQLGFVMRDSQVTALSKRRDQYDYWFNPSLHKGQNALIVADRKHSINELSPYFDRLELLEKVPYRVFGKILNQPEIYLGVNFRGDAP